MTVEKLKPGTHHGLCHNGCRSFKGSQEAGPAAAAYRMWIIGRPTLLCRNCGPEWEAVWASVLRKGERAAAA